MSKRRLIAIVIVLGLMLLANVFSPYKVDHVAVELKPEVVGHIGPFALTNTIIGSWVTMLILVLLSLLARRKLADIPKAYSVQNLVEMGFDALLSFMSRFVGDSAILFFPIVCTFFLFIVVSNWLGLVPGFGSIGIHQVHDGHQVFVPLFRASTSDLNTTVALACWSVASSQYFGMRALGVGHYLGRFVAIGGFIDFGRTLVREKRFEAKKIVSGVLDLFIGLLEVFEEITKVLSFSFRLFGNVFGGEVLLAVMAFLMPYVISLPFMAIEVFTGFIQAFIFAVLSTAFYGRAVAAHSQEDSDESLTDGGGQTASADLHLQSSAALPRA